MLYLMRKPGQSIIINNDIEMQVIEVKGKAVKIGFTFPKGASVLRKELYDKIMSENLTAAQSDSQEDTRVLGNLPTLTLSRSGEGKQEE